MNVIETNEELMHVQNLMRLGRGELLTDTKNVGYLSSEMASGRQTLVSNMIMDVRSLKQRQIIDTIQRHVSKNRADKQTQRYKAAASTGRLCNHTLAFLETSVHSISSRFCCLDLRLTSPISLKVVVPSKMT